MKYPLRGLTVSPPKVRSSTLLTKNGVGRGAAPTEEEIVGPGTHEYLKDGLLIQKISDLSSTHELGGLLRLDNIVGGVVVYLFIF